MDKKPCYCGSGMPFTECCEPYILGVTIAPTAEALMRSRYSAYVVRNEAYLLKTWHTSTRPARVGLSHDNPKRWLPLTIHAIQAGAEQDRSGTVEFSTGYFDGGTITPLHEASRFCKEEGEWFYIDGTFQHNSVTTKIGRNDPCPCGSGKKYKKCCG